MVFAPYRDVAKLEDLETWQAIRFERLAGERFGVGDDESRDILQVVWRDWYSFVEGLTDLESRRRHEVRQRFVSDGPARAQDMSLEPTGADD